MFSAKIFKIKNNDDECNKKKVQNFAPFLFCFNKSINFFNSLYINYSRPYVECKINKKSNFLIRFVK